MKSDNPQLDFFSEDTSFVLKEKKKVRAWLISVAAYENKQIRAINFIFCSDLYLLEINRKYLSHDDFTDVITFDYSEDNLISGDIYISIERVRENARKFKVASNFELCRVMVHGVLHLAGYSDKKKKDKAKMRELENHYLTLFS